jgi:hypothetical protein
LRYRSERLYSCRPLAFMRLLYLDRTVTNSRREADPEPFRGRRLRGVATLIRVGDPSMLVL